MRALWSLVLILGCTKKEQPAPPPAPEKPPTAGSAAAAGSGSGSAAAGSAAAGSAAPSAACTERADKLGKRLQELAAATPGFMPMIKDVHAPESAAGKPIDTRGQVIAVTKDGKFFAHGSPLATTKDLGQFFDSVDKKSLESFIMAGGAGKDAKFIVYVWADRDAPGSAVADILDQAKAHGTHFVPRLLVAGKGPAPDPAKHSKLPASEPEATKFVADQIKSAIGTCKGIITPFVVNGFEDDLATKRSDTLVKALPKGFAECDCKIPDPDLFESMTAEWFGEWAPPLAWIDMPTIAKGDKKPVGKLVK